MAMGRPPKPTNIRKFEGTRGHHPYNLNEPIPDPTLPVCPDWLDAEARAEWTRRAPQLAAMGVLTSVDGPALAHYCLAYSQAKAAFLAIRELGWTFETASGYLMPRPEVGIYEKSARLMRLFMADFGMSPSARTRLTAAPKPTDEFESMLSG